MWSLSDETLLAGLASGDPEAATAFVRRFQGRVFGLAMVILGDPVAADEAAQETFVRAWRYAGGFDASRGAVAPWLLTIARNVSVDAARLRPSEPMDPAALAALPIPSGEDTEERAVTSAESERLLQAISELPDEQRRALVAAAFHGRTAREIGEREGIPLGTAKTRIRAAMLKLRAAMEVGDER